MSETGFTQENVSDLISAFGGPLTMVEISEQAGWPPLPAILSEHSIVGVIIPSAWTMKIMDGNLHGAFTAIVSAPAGLLPKPGWTLRGMRVERVKSYVNGLDYIGHKLWLSGEPK